MVAAVALPLVLALLAACDAALTDLVVITGEHAACPESFQRVGAIAGGTLNGDFNEGCGSSTPYIWLCAQDGGGGPITGLTVLASDNAFDGCGGLGPAWQRVRQDQGSNGDFNQGAHGKYVYLCFTKEATIGTPIASLAMTEDQCAGDGGFRIPTGGDSNGDFNQGAGGKYIYLCATRACVVTQLTGEWQYKFDIPSAQTTFSIEYGTSLEGSQKITEDWSSSVTSSVEAGFDVDGFSAKTRIEASETHRWAQEQTSSWKTDYGEKWTTTFDPADKGKAVWQFVLSSNGVCGQGSSFTTMIALTDNGQQQPCCKPGGAEHAPYYNVCVNPQSILNGADPQWCKVASLITV